MFIPMTIRLARRESVAVALSSSYEAALGVVLGVVMVLVMLSHFDPLSAGAGAVLVLCCQS
jgi:hypothetical protein